MKMNLRSLAVALLLATFCVPASLMATTGTGPDGNPNGPPPIMHPPLPPDGNPNGPPPKVAMRLAER